jgi:ABC-2 type transport system ATP-binding protein
VKPIVVKDLVKDFNGIRAVDGISFEVEEGEIFGLLGPNGAGKTTTIMILVTLIRPTSGKAFVAGYDVTKNPSMVRKNIGVVFQETTLDLELTARENLDFHARLYGLSKEKRKKRINEVLEVVGLVDKANVLVKKFSGGMKRRLEIARGLVHFPKVLFLDEPTLGLDAHTRRKIWSYIEQMREKEDVTIILTTHYIEEAEKLCDRVAIMNDGKIVSIDAPENLVEAVGRDTIVIEGKDINLLLPELKGLRYVTDGNSIRIFVEKGDELLPEIISLAYRTGVKIESATIRKPSLEDVFVKLTERSFE